MIQWIWNEKDLQKVDEKLNFTYNENNPNMTKKHIDL